MGDAVEANIKALESSFTGCVNIGTSVETDVNKLFYIIRDISGRNEIKENHGPAKQGEQIRSVLDYKLAEKVLGWKPETAVKRGLKLTYDWFRRN